MKYALIFIAVVVALIGLYKKDSWPIWAFIGVSGLLIVGAIFQTLVELRSAKETEQSKFAGILKPNSKVLLSMRDNAVPKLELGDGGTIFSYGGPQGQPLFKILGDNELTLITDEGRVKVSTIIRNKTGTAVAELINNEWKVNKNSTFDRNFSKDALEVKDDTGDIVLQIRVVADRVQFQGKFYDSKGNGVALGKHSSGEGGIMEMTGSNHPHLKMKIEPIFQYPSENHLGEFLNKRENSI